jgi:hypothetical protein
VSLLPVDIALLHATFPDWRIIAGREAWFAIKRDNEPSSHRFDGVGRPALAASTPADLRGAACRARMPPLGIVPMS